MAFSVPRGALLDGLYWDTLDAYHYVRLQPGRGNGDYLIVGGGDHKSGEADDADSRFLALESWMPNLLPSLGKEKHRWSGQIQNTIDYCAFIGLNPGSKRTYVATGDSGQRITHGVVAGILISDLILKNESPWTEVYDPLRKPVKAAGTFLTENLTVPKNFFEDVAPGEKDSWEDLKPGEGAIVRKGLNKVAAYRHTDGQLYLRSARCPWECPCHGSQFAPEGTALNGPAFSALGEFNPSWREWTRWDCFQKKNSTLEELEMREEKPKGTRCPGINGLISEGEDLTGDISDKSVLDAAIVSCAQAVEHYEITRYGGLISWAEEMGRGDFAGILQVNLDEEKGADKKLSVLAESRINSKAGAQGSRRRTNKNPVAQRRRRGARRADCQRGATRVRVSLRPSHACGRPIGHELAQNTLIDVCKARSRSRHNVVASVLLTAIGWYDRRGPHRAEPPVGRDLQAPAEGLSRWPTSPKL